MAALAFLRLLVAVALLVLSTPRDSAACSCVPDVPLCESFWSSDAVFEGEVVEVTDRKDAPTPFAKRRARFTVARVWRGDVPASVDVMTGSGGGDCGYGFRKGRKYLVYASEGQSGLVTNSCSPTKPLDRAAPDLEYVNTTLARDADGRIYGAVRWVGGRPAARFTVLLQGGADGQKATVTKADGGFEFAGTPPGAYTVRVIVAEPDKAYGREDVKLAEARACARRDFTIERPR
jgi:hypothetical protein